MVLRKWNKIFVRTGPGQGVQMLLVEKLIPTDAQDLRWTVIDPVLRVQVANLKNKSVYSLKAIKGVVYSPMVGLDSKQKVNVEKASWELVRRQSSGIDVTAEVRPVRLAAAGAGSSPGG